MNTLTKTTAQDQLGQYWLVCSAVVLCCVVPWTLLMLVNTSLKTMPSFMKMRLPRLWNFKFENFSMHGKRQTFPKYLLNSFYTQPATIASTSSRQYLWLSPFPADMSNTRMAAGNVCDRPLFAACADSPIPADSALGLYNTPIGLYHAVPCQSHWCRHSGQLHQNLPKELDEAAALDGCGYFQFVWSRRVIPLSKPAIATVAVLHAIGIWNEIVAPTIYLTNKITTPSRAV
jgi:raffinose/stachyose/melibiose transport system permease protein